MQPRKKPDQNLLSKTLKENLTCIHDEKSNGKETYLSEKGKKGRKSV